MDNVLSELLPRKVRLWIYVIAFFGALGLGLWEAAEGDYVAFATSLAVALSNALAARNVPSPTEEA